MLEAYSDKCIITMGKVKFHLAIWLRQNAKSTD